MTPSTMTRYVAFLRAINVGGHVVKMDRLRQLLEALGLSNVRTFIASGNVIFDSAARNAEALESRIAGHLEKALGYEVATFVRTVVEVRRIAAAAPFPPTETGAPGSRLYIGLFESSLGPAIRKTLVTFRTEVDDFHADRKELYWLCRVPMLESKVSYARLEKAFGQRATFRNANTIRRIAAILEEDSK
jgi:uncharacterized protein (DUF1697 family)